VIALLRDVSTSGDSIADHSNRHDTEDSDDNDRGYNDQDDFERTAAAGRWGGRWGRCWRGLRSWGAGRATGESRRENGRAAFAAESDSWSDGCAAGIAECHTLPRGENHPDARVYRRWGRFQGFRVKTRSRLCPADSRGGCPHMKVRSLSERSYFQDRVP